jgi:hypothetical protein
VDDFAVVIMAKMLCSFVLLKVRDETMSAGRFLDAGISMKGKGTRATSQ